MTKEETQKVRLAAKALLTRLREETPKVLVQDWFKDSQSKRQVRSAVEKVLNHTFPRATTAHSSLRNATTCSS